MGSLYWERLRWRGQGDKRATANNKSVQVMEKGGVEERETERHEVGKNTREILREAGCLALTQSIPVVKLEPALLCCAWL